MFHGIFGPLKRAIITSRATALLTKRVILLLTFLDGVLFRTKRFIPDLRYTLNFVDLASADEVVCIHLGGDWDEFRKAVCQIADVALTPLSIGGGIKTRSQFDRCLNDIPADKVVLGPGGWYMAAACGGRWGRQSVVCGYTHGKDPIPDTSQFGEILIQSVDRDGSLGGYDLDLIYRWRDEPIPVVIGSGCGSWKHMEEGFNAGADACATNNIFHFTGKALGACKTYLDEAGIAVRV